MQTSLYQLILFIINFKTSIFILKLVFQLILAFN